jgi:arabinofuranosyltransferase
VLAAAALPLLYQLWRMAYFGLLVPNTALAKSASSTWWSQGWTYLVNFVSPYWLWLPIAILVGITLKRAYGWWGDGDRLTCLLMAAPFVGGLLDALYVVSIGGDFMHARMLIPGFFGVSLALWIEVPRTTPDRVALGAVLVWAVVCVVGLRYGEQLINPSTGIANERTYYIAASGQEHPITLSDYASSNWKRYGDILRQIADRSGTSAIDHAVLTPQPMALPTLPIEPPVIVEGRPPGPAQLVAPVFNIGISGDAAGPGVYLYDELSLANPISSHFTLETHGRPGHEKVAPLVWMFARFGGSRAIADYDEALAVNDNQPTPPPQTAEAAITDARLALSCQPLAGYLHAISSPFSLGAAFSDLFHSYTWTTMTFDSNPTSAKLELCLQSPLGSTIGRASMRGR